MKKIKLLKGYAKENNLSFFSVVLDFVKKRFSSGCNLSEYILLDLKSKTKDECKNEYTEGKRKKLISKSNKEESASFFDREKFFRKFGDMCGRKHFDGRNQSEKDFREFLDSVDEFILKPICAPLAEHLTRTEPSDVELVGKYMAMLREKNLFAEEFIIQHQTLCGIGGKSVNSISIVTKKDGDGVKTVFASLNLGNGRDIENTEDDGRISVLLNTENWKTEGKARDIKGNEYEAHPETKIILDGIPMPYGEEIGELAVKAAERSDIAVVKWNIAITVAGPVLISAEPIPVLINERLLLSKPFDF